MSRQTLCEPRWILLSHGVNRYIRPGAIFSAFSPSIPKLPTKMKGSLEKNKMPLPDLGRSFFANGCSCRLRGFHTANRGFSCSRECLFGQPFGLPMLIRVVKYRQQEKRENGRGDDPTDGNDRHRGAHFRALADAQRQR